MSPIPRSQWHCRCLLISVSIHFSENNSSVWTDVSREHTGMRLSSRHTVEVLVLPNETHREIKQPKVIQHLLAEPEARWDLHHTTVSATVAPTSFLP